MYEHVFDIVDFNDKYETNGHQKFERLLNRFGLNRSENDTLHCEWINHSHTLILITENDPLTGKHSYDTSKPLRIGYLGHTEVLCEDQAALREFVNAFHQMN